MDRHLVVELILPIHDGNEMQSLLSDDSDSASVTTQLAQMIGIIDNRIQVTYIAYHGDEDEDDQPHLHAEPGQIIRMRLDGEQWLDFVMGQELFEE